MKFDAVREPLAIATRSLSDAPLRRLIQTLLCACTFGGIATNAYGENVSASGSAVQAIWHTQAIDLHFRSETQRYRCEELASRIAAILEPLARDVRVELQCLDGLSDNVRARIVVTALVEASEANLERATQQVTPTQKLVARVRGEPVPEVRIETFAAQWRDVWRSWDGASKLRAADCDLVQALSRQVLPRLSVRNLRLNSSCGMLAQPPRMRVQALLPVDPDLDGLTRDAG